MRTLFFIAFSALLWNSSVQSQSCLPNGITFYSQADIDNFPVNYPGCTMIGGDVLIANSNGSNITNLNGLSALTAIGGQLNLYNNPVLTSLSGLNNLTTVGGGFSLIYQPVLANLNGLVNLTTVGGYFSIRDNDALTSLNGLVNLSAVGNLDIQQNDGLTSLDGLQPLSTVGGDLAVSDNPGLTSLNGLQGVNSVGGTLYISSNPLLPSLSSLENITSAGGGLSVQYLPLLSDLNALSNITTLGGGLWLSNLPSLTSLAGLNNIQSVGGDLYFDNLPQIADLSALGNVATVGGGLTVSNMSALTSLAGLNNMTFTGGDLIFSGNPLLANLSSMGSISSVGQLNIYNNDALTDLSGLETVTTVAGWFAVAENASLTSLHGLDNVTSFGYGISIYNNDALLNFDALGNAVSTASLFLQIQGNGELTSLSGLGSITSASLIDISNNPSLTSLAGLGSLSTVQDSFGVYDNAALNSISDLTSLTKVGRLSIHDNPLLTSLNGLDNLVSITQNFGTYFGSLVIANNNTLSSISGLQHLIEVGGIQIVNNPLLPQCAFYAVCNHLLNEPDLVLISNNAPGCNSPAEVASQCNNTPVLAEVRLDDNNNCQADATDTRAANVQVRLEGAAQMNLRATDANGQVRFGFLENGLFNLHLPQFPAGHWAVCQEPITLDAAGATDTIKTTLLLSPLILCPELTVNLGLPSFFRGCLVNSKVEVSVQNTGTMTAQGVKAAVVMPAVLQLVNAVPQVSMQSGDTLFFDLGDMPAFAATTVVLTVKTDCNTFLINQTLCVEAFASLENPCPNTLPDHSEIRLSSECIGGNTVRFTLENIGDAPTQGWHEYKIIRNESVSNSNSFTLGAHQSMTVDVPADGATYRMEATKFDDQTQTATAIENCGGLTPGLITAFWQDEGPLEYDLGCRLVNGSYDPNLKSAVPAGAGSNHVISANTPLEYTIDFQNTGTDTAFRVLLRDELPEGLDINTFRPGAASHAYTWEIRDLNILEVLFSPIVLPDINANEPASHGYFSFTIDQKPNLPEGFSFYNAATIVFDFNPPIGTSYIWHTIGQLSVRVDDVQPYANLWKLWGNPVQETATFRAEQFIAGEKQFELYDSAGRRLRSAQFSGQEFDFQRDGLPDGLYFFRISDAQGRIFTGKIIVGQ